MFNFFIGFWTGVGALIALAYGHQWWENRKNRPVKLGDKDNYYGPL